VGSENVLLCFFKRPALSITEGAFKTVFMGLFNNFAVIFRDGVAADWVL